MNDNYHYAQMILTMIVTVCLVYLAMNNFALFLAMTTFQLVLLGIVTWRSNREISNGNKQ